MNPWRAAIIIWIIAIMLGGAWLALAMRSDRAAGASDRNSSGAPAAALLLTPEAWPIERIDGIEVRRGGGSLRFERRGDGWFQIDPYDQPAEGAALRELLLLAAERRVSSRTKVSEVDLAALGLSPPQAELIATAGGRSTRLQLGRRSVGGRAWIRVDEGDAISTQAVLHDALLDGDLRQLRSWRLFDRIGSETDRIVVNRTPLDPARPAQRLELERIGGAWRMVAPFRTRVDAAPVEALLGALARIEHAGFADDAPADLALYGLERPIASIEVHTPVRGRGTNEPPLIERIEIGSSLAQGGAICARRSDRPAVVLLDATALAALMPLPETFPDPTVLGIKPEDVRGIRVRAAEGALLVELERTLDGWMIVGADGARAPAQGPAIGLLLERLTATRATALALHPMPAELLLATIEVVPSIGEARVVRVAREPNDGRWALDESDEVLRIFPASFELPLDPRLFGAVEIQRAPADQR